MSTKLTGYVWDGCAASGMKLSSVAIMARLADFSNDEGVCWPSIETIARQIGAGMSTVRTAIARLEAEGWLTRKARRQGDGSSPHCAVVDEYHEHATDALYTTMLTGMGARRQPLMWAITTAGYNIEGPCYDKRREVIEMLNGSVPNDELFGIIYTVDEGDDWTDPQVLEKANPNIGVSVYREFLLSQQQRAKNNARLANVFKTKHLNIWASARSAYFNLVSWQSCEDKSLTLEQFEGQPCILAFDLARKLDMNSMARLYTREIDGKTHYYSVAPRFWVPYDTVYSVEKNEDRRTAERFQKWVEMGVLTVTDGAEVDYRYILEEAKAANKISPVSESPIDPSGRPGCHMTLLMKT